MKRLFISVLALAVAALTLAPNAAAQSDARIHLIHGIPGIDVDVAVDGANVFEGFSFGDTQDLSSFAGATLAGVQVLVAGTDDVAIDVGDLQLPASGSYTAIAHLTADGTPSVAVFENDVSATAAGQGRLTVRHAAAAPAVDILANGDAAFTNVPNGAEGTVDLPAGTIEASVVPAGETEPVVIGPAPLPITEGASLIVYAVGSLEGDSLTVLTESIEGLATPPAAVNTGNSPIAADGISTLSVVLVALAAAAVLGGTALAAPTVARARD